MTNLNKLSLGIIIGFILVIGVLFGTVMYMNNKAMGANPVANTSGVPVNLIGTQVGTTTTPVAFYTGHDTASTTYPFRIGQNTDIVTLTFLAKDASTTGASIQLSLLASNDMYCDTASTTTTMASTTVTGDINWYDASANIKDLAGSTTLSSGTSTVITWSSVLADTGRQITLTDLNTECLAVEVSASSTKLMSQFVTKSKN